MEEILWQTPNPSNPWVGSGVLHWQSSGLVPPNLNFVLELPNYSLAQMQPESSMGRDSGEVCKVSLKSSPDLWETPEMTDLNMSKVWNALFPWFERSGYNLYVPKPDSPHLWVPSEGNKYLLTDVVRYPYAHYSDQEPTRREFKAEVCFSRQWMLLMIRLIQMRSTERTCYRSGKPVAQGCRHQNGQEWVAGVGYPKHAVIWTDLVRPVEFHGTCTWNTAIRRGLFFRCNA